MVVAKSPKTKGDLKGTFYFPRLIDLQQQSLTSLKLFSSGEIIFQSFGLSSENYALDSLSLIAELRVFGSSPRF